MFKKSMLLLTAGCFVFSLFAANDVYGKDPVKKKPKIDKQVKRLPRQTVPPRVQAMRGAGRFQGRGPGYVDENGDGVCDRFQKGQPPLGGQGRGYRGRGPGYVDQNNDGICDRYQQGLPPVGGQGRGFRGRFAGRGPGYVDQNGDGVCDRFQKGQPPVGGQGRGYAARGWGRGYGYGRGAAGSYQPGYGYGRGYGRGRGMGGGRFAGRGPGYVDQNSDGVCDRLQQNLPPAGGQGRGFRGRGQGWGRGRW